jgi:Glu-tRNA(Gln) amidotransferase subunit E-like FAD-binding protein
MNPKDIKEFKEELSKTATLIADMVSEEISAVTKAQKEHQSKDDKMFEEVIESLSKTQINHDEIIRMLQQSASDRKALQSQIGVLITTVESHKKIVSRGEGIMWFLGISFTGGFLDLVYHFFGRK